MSKWYAAAFVTVVSVSAVMAMLGGSVGDMRGY